MASQGFIQPIAQDRQATIPNNGNPNTVYNRAATAAPVQGWAANPITPAANFNGVDANATIANSNQNIATNGWVAPAATTVPQGQGVLQLPAGWADQMKAPVVAPTPVPTPEPTKPAVDLNKQWVVMNGKTPGKNDALYASDPAYAWAYDTTLAEHRHMFKGKGYTKDSDPNWIANRVKELYQDNKNNIPYVTLTEKENAAKTGKPLGAVNQAAATGTANPSAPASGGNYNGIGLGSKMVDARTAQDIAAGVAASQNAPRASSWNSDSGKSIGENLTNFVDNTISTLGNNATAGSVMKMLDALSEPFLPGNMYMSELGALNMPNILSAIMNKAVPGLGTLGKWLATKIPADAGGLLGKLRDWVMNGKLQEAANAIYKQYDMEAAQNQAIYGGGTGRPSAGTTAGGGAGWLGGGSYGSGDSGHGMTGSVTVGPGEKIPVVTQQD